MVTSETMNILWYNHKKMKIYEPELHTHTRGLGGGGGQDVLEY